MDISTSSAVHDVYFDGDMHPQTSDTIEVWDQVTGQTRILFDIIDHLSPSVDRTPSSSDPDQAFFWRGCPEVEGVEDWTHSNSLFVGSRGNVIMSLRHLDQIISISPDFQTLEWRLAGPGSDFAFVDPSDQFYHQHTAQQLSNGNILLFDNGNLRPGAEGGEYSQALELELNMEDMTVTKVWEYRHPPDLFAYCCSSATRLDNGNTILIFGADFGPGFPDVARPPLDRVFVLVEADSSGRTVWEIHMKFASPEFETIQYRVYPLFSIYGEIEV